MKRSVTWEKQKTNSRGYLNDHCIIHNFFRLGITLVYGPMKPIRSFY